MTFGPKSIQPIPRGTDMESMNWTPEYKTKKKRLDVLCLIGLFFLFLYGVFLKRHVQIVFYV